MGSGPQPYPVVYDTDNGLRYVFESGLVAISDVGLAITALTGNVTATGPGSVPATIASGVIVNSMVASAAAIALTKLAALTASIVPVTNSSGFLVASSTTTTELGYVHGVTSAIQTQLNGKQATLTIGNLTDAGTDGITVTGGTGAIIGSGTSLAQHVADASHNGYLSSTDWSTFNGKQATITVGTSGFVVTSNGSTLASSPSGIGNVIVTATSGTITPDASLGNTFSTAVAGAVTYHGPINGVDGQKITFRVVNDASHSVTFATGSGNFSFGTTFTSYTNSVSLIDYVGCIWNAAASVWHIVAITQGF